MPDMKKIILRTSRVFRIVAILMVCSSGFALAQEETPPAAQDEAPVEVGIDQAEVQDAADEDANDWNFHLYADEQYRLRMSSEESERDQDLSLYLDFGFTNPADNFGGDLSFGFWTDMDGEPGEDSSPSFADPKDSSFPIWLEVYKLSLDYHSEGIVKLARAGRQVTEYGRDAVFDGVSLVLAPWKPYIEIFMLGGRSVHFFDLDSSFFEDWLAGVGTVVRPHKDLKLELAYRFSREETVADFGSVGAVDSKVHMDHSAGLDIHYRYKDWFYLQAFMQSANEDIAEMGGKLRFEWVEKEFGVDVGAKAQPSTLGEITEAEDPYMSILGESLPFVRFNGDLWKAYTTPKGIYAFHVGYEGRQLTLDDETPFNRNFGRVYTLFSMSDIGVKGPFISLIFERWAEGPDLSDDGLWAVGGSAGYDVDVFRGEVGTRFDRFKYDYYLDVDEKMDVQTYFVDLRGRVVDWLYIKGRYEFERFDRDIHTVTIGLSQVY